MYKVVDAMDMDMDINMQFARPLCEFDIFITNEMVHKNSKVEEETVLYTFFITLVTDN